MMRICIAFTLFHMHAFFVAGLYTGENGRDHKVEIRGGGHLIRTERASGTRSASAGAATIQLDAIGNADLAPLTIVAPPASQLEGKAMDARDAESSAKQQPSTGFSSPQCVKLLDKIKTLLKKGTDTHGRETVNGTTSAPDILTFRDNIDFMTLSKGIKTGEVWTVDDQTNLLEDCFLMGTVQNLEEHILTCDPSTCGHAASEPLFQGDIVLSTPEQASFIEQGKSFKLKPVKAQAKTRTGSVNIPYCVANGTEAAAVTAFEAAVKHFGDQVHCLNFTKIGTGADDRCESSPAILLGSHHPGCWSYLGQHDSKLVWGQEQSLLQGISWGTQGHADGMIKVNLGDGCETMGMAAHQLGHAVGMVHEMWRHDRDEFVDVHPEHMAFAERGDILKEGEGISKSPFDFLSLMMWSQHAFSEDGSTTIIARKQPLLGHYFGQRMGLSQLDVEHLGNMYQCGADTLKPLSHTKAISHSFLEGKGLTFDHTCVDSNYTGVQYTDGRGVVQFLKCDQVEAQCHEDEHVVKDRLAHVCPNSCLQCFPAPAWMIQLARGTTGTTTQLWQNKHEYAEQKAVMHCTDSEKTNIRFTGSVHEATCKDLHHYCHGHLHSDNVQNVCPKTCGRCSLTMDMGKYSFAGNETNCDDQSADTEPIFTLAGRNAGCHELFSFCKNHPHSDIVKGKCGHTCGNCKKGVLAFHARHEITTTVAWGVNHAPKEPGEEGCSRRRRWGFCYTRRRNGGMMMHR